MRDLSGQVVMVVGASGGLGMALTQSLTERGARLCLTTRSAERLKGAPASAHVFVGDVTESSFAERALAAAVNACGKLDGVINASGVVAFGPLKDTNDETMDALWAINVAGPLRLMRAFAASNQGGFFVNISGVVAESPYLGLSVYGAAKAALSSATRAFAMEARRQATLVIDARPPHTETALSTHPIAGTAPRMPKGLAPSFVAERIVRAIEQEEREVPASAFAP